jgi:hypothetical protein
MGYTDFRRHIVVARAGPKGVGLANRARPENERTSAEVRR